jgi:NTE family protein
MPKRCLLLAGGNALGCYLAGGYQALHEAGEEPDWIAGTSIGAVTAALIAGNPPEQRAARLRQFWTEARAPDWLPWRQGAQWLAAVQTRLLGRPALFHLRLPKLLDQPPGLVGLYDRTPMRRSLERLIDFNRLNAGDMRVSVLAVDLQCGAEVVFDTTTTRLTVEHLMASSALIPDFPPVRISDRWLVDGGMTANVPVDYDLGQEQDEDMLCFLLDLFPIEAAVPHDLAGMTQRQSDLIFACQTEKALHAFAALDRTRPAPRPRIDVVRTSYAADAVETIMKSWDFSDTALSRRWEVGRRDMQAALRRFHALPSGGTGLTIHPITRG